MKNEKWIQHLNHWVSFLDERLSRVEDYGERTKISRQRKALEDVRFAAVLNPKLLLEFISPTEEPSFDCCISKYLIPLNESQKHAVNLALSDNVLTLIQGPPGTGKTQVITEICLQLYKKDPNIRILVCSETHIAVNNLLTRLQKNENTIRVVRIRDKEQDESSDICSPETIIKKYTDWLRSNLVNRELAELIAETMSNSEDRSLEKALALSANVTGMTCNRVGAYLFNSAREMFDVVIIDEVCKATLPEILMPLSVARKAILVGDPKQLPPVFCSEELDVIRSIDSHELQEYMYIDKLFALSKCVSLLDTQYRMAERICSLVGSLFYSGKLINGRSSDYPGMIKWLNYIPSQQWPLISEKDTHEIYNLDECTVISSMLTQLDRDATSEQTVAIITPYRSQVNKIKNNIKECVFRHIIVRIDTVDGFQGKECDAVIFSLTRTHGSFRFLADVRRLNVALSRAKNHLVMVGNLEYAKRNNLLSRIVEFSEVETVSWTDDIVQ